MAVKLFVSLGYKSAMNWDDEKIEKRLNSLQSVAEEKALSVEKDMQQLVEKVIENAGSIELVEDAPEDAPEDTAGKDCIEEKVAKEFVKDSKAAAPKKERKKREPKKVGVIATIIEMLEKQPTDKISIWNALVEAFPERDSAAMKRTVQSAVPSGLRTIKKIDVKKTNDNKFYIEQKKD